MVCTGTVLQTQKEGHDAATVSLENTAIRAVHEPQKATRRERPAESTQVASGAGVRRSLGEDSCPEPASQKPKKVTSHTNEEQAA